MTTDAYVYFMTNRTNEVLYIGVTSNLIRRVAEHQLGVTGGFTHRYRCQKLVYYESGEDISAAIVREKQLKEWHRAWKNRLVAEQNPYWRDLSADIGITPEVLAAVAQAHRPSDSRTA